MSAEGSAPWWRGAVLYQIYPRSFCDSNGDGVGDLAGITGKLDYVAALGVDGVWLSPFFASPMKDFGYDVADYRAVDPVFGTLADFDALLARAHALKLKVIIDQVWAHTSEQHPWFQQSAAAREGPKSDWYVWADAKPDGAPPNNWQASFGGASWTWSPRRRQYYFHNFLPEQPDLNYWNPKVQDEILAIGRFWLDRGVDGVRLDVINYLFHDKALRDNPEARREDPPLMPAQFQRHVFDRSRPQTLAFVARLRALLDSYPARMAVGEVVDVPALPRQIEYTAGPERLHTAYSFHLLAAHAAPPALFAQAMAAWEGTDGWPSWSLGNHDVARFPTRLAHSGDRRQARALMTALMALRGTIFLYQGEELGLPQAKVPFAALKDPFAIAAFTGEAGRDGARTPMPWTTEGPSAGFSATTNTWLPLDPVHRPLAVAAQEAAPDSFLAFTRQLIALRAAHPALRSGEARVADAPQGVLALERTLGEERLLCLVNLSAREVVCEAPGVLRPAETFLGGVVEGERAVRLPPFGAAVAMQA